MHEKCADMDGAFQKGLVPPVAATYSGGIIHAAEPETRQRSSDGEHIFFFCYYKSLLQNNGALSCQMGV